jgi:hypothetical protein
MASVTSENMRCQLTDPNDSDNRASWEVGAPRDNRKMRAIVITMIFVTTVFFSAGPYLFSTYYSPHHHAQGRVGKRNGAEGHVGKHNGAVRSAPRHIDSRQPPDPSAVAPEADQSNALGKTSTSPGNLDLTRAVACAGVRAIDLEKHGHLKHAAVAFQQAIHKSATVGQEVRHVASCYCAPAVAPEPNPSAAPVRRPSALFPSPTLALSP